MGVVGFGVVGVEGLESRGLGSGSWGQGFVVGLKLP